MLSRTPLIAPEPAARPAKTEGAGAPPEPHAPLPSRPSRFRHDGLFWRRLAFWGSTRAPRWWRRIGPTIVAAVAFAFLGENRRHTIEKLRVVRGERRRLRLVWDALGTFVEFAYCVSESFELQSPSARPLEIESPAGFDPRTVLPDGQGLVVLTSHFGNWEIGARALASLGRPVNVVLAHEANPTVDAFQRDVRERHGLRIIHSDSSVFSSLNMVHALRRGEVVAIQLDRSAPGQVTRLIDFFGRPAPFQYGPFALARIAGVPLWPVFVARTGPRRYRFLHERLRRIDRHASEAETLAVMTDVVGSFETTVRAYPRQWFHFRPFWEPADCPG